MQQVVENLIKKANEHKHIAPEYTGEDGLLHCSVCNAATQVQVEIFEEKRIVRCICKCQQAEREAEAERKKREENERARRRCFAEANMSEWNFKNDDRQNPKISDAMKRYVENFEAFKADSKGLLLYGSCGTGKTYHAACVANALIDKGYTVTMTNFATLINRLQGMFEGRQEYIERLNRCALLIIDDLGAERKTEYMQETVFNIIDSRYRSGLPLIVTTNLTPEEIKQPQDVGYQRIYDRILERCFPVEVAGTSRRRKELKDTYSDTKALLGL